MGNVRARIQLAQLLIADNGSPLDFEDAYRWLYQTVTTDKRQHQQLRRLRQQLALKMPVNIIARAKRRSSFW